MTAEMEAFAYRSSLFLSSISVLEVQYIKRLIEPAEGAFCLAVQGDPDLFIKLQSIINGKGNLLFLDGEVSKDDDTPLSLTSS